ncbi:DUF2178 domain-containing protein [Thermococcus sp. LS1]|uniref:DUF2178 domain-containing protein n=1 Tax=Thermococcus sp. LS1 TaxID=1638259 RepID=UPI00143B5B87|nr:DUF2178 domain-containing protein [Thermococcus sp. LS1]NJD98347.1 DUF2178 domain-containing protein [Thermococcus sp. LS1]
MNELALISLVSIAVGGILGYFLSREIVTNIGIPPDERAEEISKRAAMKTLELVLLVTVVSLYYYAFVTKSEDCANAMSLIFATIFFGNMAFRAYYSRKM